MPIAVCFSTGFLTGILTPVSTRMETKYFPVGVLLTVALRILPCNWRCRTILIPPLNFGTSNLFSDTDTACGQWKDWLFERFLKLGNPARPFKKLVYAISRLSRAHCNDWLLTSRSHAQPFFKSVSCFCKSYRERFAPCAEYAHVLVSSARLYTNRTHPKCFSNSSFCESDGYKRYLFAFSNL